MNAGNRIKEVTSLHEGTPVDDVDWEIKQEQWQNLDGKIYLTGWGLSIVKPGLAFSHTATHLEDICLHTLKTLW